MEFFIAATMIAALIWLSLPRRALKPAPITARTTHRRHPAHHAFRE